MWNGIDLLTLFYSRFLISVFHYEVAENCAVLRYYAASSNNLLQTFRDNLTISSAGLKNPVVLNCLRTINSEEGLCLEQLLSRNKTGLSIASYS